MRRVSKEGSLLPQRNQGQIAPQTIQILAQWTLREKHIFCASKRVSRKGFYFLFSSLLHKSKISSVAQSCPTLCDPMDCSMPGFPVHHQLPELTQTHVHWVGDAIQPSHSLLPPSPPAFNLSQHQGLFKTQGLFIKPNLRSKLISTYTADSVFFKHSVTSSFPGPSSLMSEGWVDEEISVACDRSKELWPWRQKTWVQNSVLLLLITWGKCLYPHWASVISAVKQGWTMPAASLFLGVNGTKICHTISSRPSTF